MIQWAPFFKSEDKPKNKSDIFKLSTDVVEKVVKKRSKKITEQDMKVYEALNFNK